MCLFRAIGKIIDESGLPEMLTESGVLASGSSGGFIRCTNFNRCKRLHPMLALALEILHFSEFLTGYEHSDDIKEAIREAVLTSKDGVDVLVQTTEFEKLFHDYASFSELTLDGKRGKTAQFCMEYIERVGIYHIIDRSVRESNIDLYCEALTSVVDIFFATNRINYARWMSKHQIDLINLPTTHPGLKEMLSAGLFSIRRTDNDFSGNPVDLTLEQTVNADSASRMTGYTASKNSYNARLRWSVTKGSRAALISAAFEMSGLRTASDVRAEMTESRIKRDNCDLNKLLSCIRANANPFTLQTDALLNINTGKCASAEISESLLTIKTVGKQKHDDFVKECIDDPDRFEKPISQNKLKTFSSQGARNRRANSPIVKELRCTRDLFGRIAIIATQREVDLEFLLQFPLTSVPLSICKTDGTMVHTDKSALFSLLEEKVNDHGSPDVVDAHIVDGNFLLHCLPSTLPPTYGGLSRVVLHMLLNLKSKRIDVVFDTYVEHSIKDCERERRGIELTSFVIAGPEQLIPKDITKALKSTSFKKQLPKFFAKDWSSSHHACVLTDRELYLGFDEKCVKFTVVDGNVERQDVDRLYCNHPEADTRICLHMVVADRAMSSGNLVVRATDTDILVILLHHIHKVKSLIWMDVGTSGRGNRRYVNVSAVSCEIGETICSALPAFHAYTGCDYTAAFARKGKKRPFAILNRDERYPEAFAKLCSGPVSEETYRILEDYTCTIYGARKSIPINEYRFKVFERAFGPKDKNKLLSKIKGQDSSSIPPCKAVVRQKVDRAQYVATIGMLPLIPCCPVILETDGNWPTDPIG